MQNEVPQPEEPLVVNSSEPGKKRPTTLVLYRKAVFSLLRNLGAAHPSYRGDKNYPVELVAKDLGFVNYKQLVAETQRADLEDLHSISHKATLVLKAYGPGPFVSLAQIEIDQSGI